MLESFSWPERCFLFISCNALAFHGLVHHLANIRKTSAPFWVLFRTMTTSCFFLVRDTFENCRPSIVHDVLLNIFGSVAKAVTYKLQHYSIPLPIRCLKTLRFFYAAVSNVSLGSYFHEAYIYLLVNHPFNWFRNKFKLVAECI